VKYEEYSEDVTMRQSVVKPSSGAEEDRFHEVVLTAIKVANGPHILPYPL